MEWQALWVADLSIAMILSIATMIHWSRLPAPANITCAWGVGTQRAVKQHVRTAEGRAEAPDQVRPIGWLRITTTYLTGELQLRALAEGHPLHMIFAFTSDRLMAVRKDLVMQDLRGAQAIALYEEIVRYLILMGYLLGDKAPPEFDAHLNMVAVRSGLATLHSLYEEAAASDGSSPSECLRNRDEFLSYQVLVHLLDVVRSGPPLGPDLGLDSILTRIPKGVHRHGSFPLTDRAVQAVCALASGNYVRLLRLFSDPVGTLQDPTAPLGCVPCASSGAEDGISAEVPPPPTPPPAARAPSPPAPCPAAPSSPSLALHRCLVHAMLPQVRRRALDLFTRSLFFKDWTLLMEVGRLLCFTDEAQAGAFCALYKVPIKRPEGQQDGGSPSAGGGGGEYVGHVANFHKKVVLVDPDVKSRERLQEVTTIVACRQDQRVLWPSSHGADPTQDWAALHTRLVLMKQQA